MDVKNYNIEGLKLLSPKVFYDNRGFFCERYRVDQFKEIGIHQNFIQDNYSRSDFGILRGLHYQWDQPQSKLVTCTRGTILDVAVDIRQASPTFGKQVMVELSGDKPQWFWIPAGFAHGFLVLSKDGADLSYKVDAPWNSRGEGAIFWKDSELSIPWPKMSPLLSEKDQKAPSFAEYKIQPRF